MGFKRLKRYSIIALILIIIMGLSFTFLKLRVNHNREIISNKIEEKVSRIIELSTIKYNYTDVLSYKDAKQLNGVNIPLTEKSFIVQYSGYLKAGIDMTTIEIDIKDKDTIHVGLEKARVLENVIVEEEVKFFDEKDAIFNKLSFEDLYEVLVEEKGKMKKQAIDNGLLNEAEDNAEEILISLLEEMDFKNIIISFK